MNKKFDSRLDGAWWALRIGLGIGPFLAGLDIAVRDLEIALAAFVLARMTEVRENTLDREALHEEYANSVIAA